MSTKHVELLAGCDETVNLVITIRHEHNSMEPVPAVNGLPPYEEATEFGIRALRNMARKTGIASHRKIGTLSRAEILALLYPMTPAES